MARRWATDTIFPRLELEVADASCGVCGRKMHVCDHRHHRIFTLQRPVHLVCKLVHCPAPTCPNHRKTFSPEAELTITLPRWVIGWDVFCWLGHRRIARHWSVSQIRAELIDSFAIVLSEDAIEEYIHRYQDMLAARQQDPDRLRQEYHGAGALMLAIDGLQPEKGHETLYVVRELGRKRVWFAESLISSSAREVRQLIIQARVWAGRLGKPVRFWMSDKQDTFVKAIAAEFPSVPHRYCSNHFLRDLAKPVLELDSLVKVQIRRKVRGLRAVERAVLDQRRQEREPSGALPSPSASRPGLDPGDVVLDYCTAVRGILNDSQGGPLHPPGVRMAKALVEVRQSLKRNLKARKGGAPNLSFSGWFTASTEESANSRRPRKRSRVMSWTCEQSTRRWIPPQILLPSGGVSSRSFANPWKEERSRLLTG
jgi:hypothetical protein